MYTYSDLSADVGTLVHPHARVFSIGQSRLGRNLYCVKVGSDSKTQIIISGGIHAREHISSYLVAKQIFHALSLGDAISKIGGISFVPMLNPDGNMLCYEGLKSVPQCMHKELLAINNGSEDFSLWKANAYGVDLNVNFDARWGTGKQNVFCPASESYVGEHAFSECESRAIAHYTKKLKADATVSYHAAGQEMYWEFRQNKKDKIRDKRLANYLNSVLQYRLVDDDGTSAGGYKDYCIQSFHIPSYTIELVDDTMNKHPILDYSCAKSDIERNIDLPIRLLKYLMDGK